MKKKAIGQGRKHYKLLGGINKNPLILYSFSIRNLSTKKETINLPKGDALKIVL